MRFLITGAKGQLAREFIKHFEREGLEYTALSREELDITNLNKVMRAFRELKPSVVINCAAYNNVDGAESDFVRAFSVNTVGVYNLALASLETGAFLIHYSTDYVFNGKKEGLYTEEDEPDPLSLYGKSKLMGESLIKDVLLGKYLLFRVSWVYGEGKQNFIHKLLGWSRDRDVLQVAFNEISVPTYTKFIVENTMKAIEHGLEGLYHLVPEGYASRYEWAKEVFRLMGINKLIKPVQKEIFNLPARRPDFSAMNSKKISRELGRDFPFWNELLFEFIRDHYKPGV